MEKSTTRLIYFVVISIVLVSVLHYMTCMFKFRPMEWQFYINLINRIGIEKVDNLKTTTVTDPVCINVDNETLATLTGLLATVLALRKAGGGGEGG